MCFPRRSSKAGTIAGGRQRRVEMPEGGGCVCEVDGKRQGVWIHFAAWRLKRVDGGMGGGAASRHRSTYRAR
jgi:hypothetical protein